MLRNILLIQNDPSDAEAVRAALTDTGDGSLHLEWVRLCSSGVERLDREEKQGSNGIDAVLVDLVLPDSQGIETFDRLLVAAHHIPILVLCADDNAEIARLAMQRGAQDYLLKSHLNTYVLPKAVRNMVERAAIVEDLFREKERAQVTLNSIADAVMSSDVRGKVTYLNPVAERLTGWTAAEAVGRPLDEVFRIVSASTHHEVPQPLTVAIAEDRTVLLAPNSVLMRRDGAEVGIDDSAAPIHDRRGRVSGAVMVFRDVTAARGLALRMSHLAQHDSLTDLPNRVLMTDRLRQAMALAERHGTGLALLFVDVDRLKHINDSLGHAIGDRLLQSVAMRLLECARHSDTVCRHGGDEFVILLSDVADAQDAAVFADKVLVALGATHCVDGHELNITVSIGIATCPGDATTVDALIHNADVAMYLAKISGRNNYQFFRPDMDAGALERLSLESDLRHAVKRREMVLHYQPIMNVESGVIIGAEALIRWRHPQRGLVPCTQFIPIAEEAGLIVPIGRWVLREACLQARAWQDAGLPPMRVAVNISAVELRARDFIADVRAVLDETGLDPRLLELELTETFLMQDPISTTAVLNKLGDMGVQLALDDFGTGYSSLSHLKRFPIDTLKIDRSFIRDLITDADDASIVRAVIGMGKSLNLRVVAEGVESREQLVCLRDEGCREAQGFLFSQAVESKEFSRILGQGLARPLLA